MKKLLLFSLLLIFSLSLPAQVASTECLEEAKRVFQTVDHLTLLAQESPTVLNYKHSYIMRSDPEGKTIEDYVYRLYKRNLIHLINQDEESCSDATESFNFRRNQNIVYRTKSSLKKGELVPGADLELFDHCLVRKCAFIPAPNHDSLSWKEAFLTVDPEGQKSYKIQDLKMTWNPVQGSLVSLTVNFTKTSRIQWATYSFVGVETAQRTVEVPSSAASLFLDASGQLAGKFAGADLKDYR